MEVVILIEQSSNRELPDSPDSVESEILSEMRKNFQLEEGIEKVGVKVGGPQIST